GQDRISATSPRLNLRMRRKRIGQSPLGKGAMSAIRRNLLSLLPAAALLWAAAATAQPDTSGEPGWTGSTHPNDVIAARRALMLELQERMQPIDSHAAGEAADPDALRE